MQNWEDDCKVVAITGNIGSGKSTVAGLYENHGYLVLRSDDVAKRLISQDTEIKDELISLFGASIYEEDGTLNRDLMRELLFTDKDADLNSEKMNGIVHPRVFEENIKAIEDYYNSGKNTKDIVFIESALAYESGMAEGCDYVVQVSLNEEIADARLTTSRGIDLDTIKAIRRRQLSQQEKERLADFTISNDKGLEDLKRSAEFILSLLQSLPPRFGREAEDEDEDVEN